MYYPKSQIITGLYSNGELTFKNNQNNLYTGPYWKNSKGEYYTGKTPQDTPIFELVLATPPPNTDAPENPTSVSYYGVDFYDSAIAFEDPTTNLTSTEDYMFGEVSVDDYLSIKKLDSTFTTSLPYFLPNIPTDNDYTIGEYRRYFCKKINEISYIEIDKKQFDLLKNKNPKIVYEYYQPFDIPWRLTGNKTFVNNVNFNMVKLTMFRQKLPMFDIYLKEDYTKYYK